MYSRTGGRCNNAYSARKLHYGTLARGIKQALRLKLCLELFKCKVQRAYTVGLYILDVYLIHTITGEHGNAPRDYHLHTVTRNKAQLLGRATEHDSLHGAALVLEREIKVTRGIVIFKIGYLAANENVRQRTRAVYQHFYILIYLSNAEHLALTCHFPHPPPSVPHGTTAKLPPRYRQKKPARKKRRYLRRAAYP